MPYAQCVPNIYWAQSYEIGLELPSRLGCSCVMHVDLDLSHSRPLGSKADNIYMFGSGRYKRYVLKP